MATLTELKTMRDTTAKRLADAEAKIPQYKSRIKELDKQIADTLADAKAEIAAVEGK